MTKPKKIHYSYNGTLSVCGIDITKSRLEPILWLHAIERFDTFKVQSPKRVCKRCKKILLSKGTIKDVENTKLGESGPLNTSRKELEKQNSDSNKPSSLKVTDEMLDDVVDKKPIDFERITTEERDGMVNFESVRIQGLPSIAQAAIKTLENLGYTYKGAELWKPPIGKKPGLNIIGKGLDNADIEKIYEKQSNSKTSIQEIADALGIVTRQGEEIYDCRVTIHPHEMLHCQVDFVSRKVHKEPELFTIVNREHECINHSEWIPLKPLSNIENAPNAEGKQFILAQRKVTLQTAIFNGKWNDGPKDQRGE